jgi:hypothetical protein
LSLAEVVQIISCVRLWVRVARSFGNVVNLT